MLVLALHCAEIKHMLHLKFTRLTGAVVSDVQGQEVLLEPPDRHLDVALPSWQLLRHLSDGLSLAGVLSLSPKRKQQRR